ncbi:hypothetical protein CC99x_006065 [Candidatus Berkiella cookevillensis]|uniref:Tetratricopeptide repeat protein n=1 Tax=Candidatus Berkiella cookevillensis TaxID=437022 RepID=A0A0Q9YHB6_9GAMM|nr:hypothetical protein [Candidatus Berkiella cookevillensis]MCS5708470.1 hypothetical protein [Candidatus Berkiella cookevillensis]
MLNGLKHTKIIDFKEELLTANTAFAKNDYSTAELHYKAAIHEISAQTTRLNKPLGPRLSLLYHKALLALVKCQISTLHAADALTTIKNYPSLENDHTQCETLILKARAFLQLGKRTEAIMQLQQATAPLEKNDFQQLAAIEAAFWLIPLLIEEHQFTQAKGLLSIITNYLSDLPVANRTTKYFLITQIECLCHASNIYRAESNISLAIHSLQKAIHLYKQYKQEFSTLIDQDIKLNILSANATLLLLLNKKSDITEILEVHQSLVELMDEEITYASLEAKTKAFNAYLIGLKLNYEQGNILIAVEQLNRALSWAQQNIIPKELICKVCIVAANLYLQPTSKRIDLALLFLNIAQKNIIFLPRDQQKLATIEILLMRLICEQQLDKTADAITIFNQLMLLKAEIDSPSSLCTLLEKLLPLFDATDNLTFQNQIAIFKIELEKIQLPIIATNMLLDILSIETSAQSTSALPPVINPPSVLLSYNTEKEENEAIAEDGNLSFVERTRRESLAKAHSYHIK